MSLAMLFLLMSAFYGKRSSLQRKGSNYIGRCNSPSSQRKLNMIYCPRV